MDNGTLNSGDPVVSVIIAAYNVERYLRRCLDSVLAQSYLHFELLVMDDGSTDGTLNILNEYAKRDNRVKVFSQHNKGSAEARNVLIKNAVGEYIAICDADDLCAESRLERQVQYLLQHPDVDLVTCGVANISQKGRIVFAVSPLVRAKSDDELILAGQRNTITHGAVMYRRRMIEKFDMPYRTRYGQDFDLWIRCLAMGSKFAAIPDVLYFYQRDSALQENGKKNSIRDAQRRMAARLLSENRLFDDKYCLERYAAIQDVQGARRHLNPHIMFKCKRLIYALFQDYFDLIWPECLKAFLYDFIFHRRGAFYLKYSAVKKLTLPGGGGDAAGTY